jgi:hypothetical protein
MQPSPLFTHQPSLFARRPHTVDDDPDLPEEEWVDASLPSTPPAQSSSSHGPLSEDTRSPFSPIPTSADGADRTEHKPNMEEDQRQCRICFGGADEEEELGRLISPCLCAGSMRVSRLLDKADVSTCMVGVYRPV